MLCTVDQLLNFLDSIIHREWWVGVLLAGVAFSTAALFALYGISSFCLFSANEWDVAMGKRSLVQPSVVLVPGNKSRTYWMIYLAPGISGTMLPTFAPTTTASSLPQQYIVSH